MRKVTIAIVEDEKEYAKTLVSYLEKYEVEEKLEIEYILFSDGDEIALNYKANYDIILMDIEMQFMDGMTAAEKIRQVDDNVIIMFITNMVNYALRGYEVQAMDFMVKPVEYFSFSQKLKRAIAKIPSNDYVLTVAVGTGHRKINLSDIMYIESIGHTIRYHLTDEQVDARGTLKEIKDFLEGHGFFQISRSYFVHMRYVDGIKSGLCQVGGTSLPISRALKQEFISALQHL